MRQKLIFFALFVFLANASLSVLAQSSDVSVKPALITGDVGSVSNSKIVLQTKDGAIDVALTEKTEYKRVSPSALAIKSLLPESWLPVKNQFQRNLFI